MSFRFLSALTLTALFAAMPVQSKELRVCADPDNLPYSRTDESGFENRIAALAAEALSAKLVYTWHAQQLGFVRKTIGASLCDVWMGVPSSFERLATTQPYYRSTYVFVYAKEKPLRSFDQPDLRRLRIGVQIPGDDLAATPPGHALVLRGAIDNVVGFPVHGAGTAAERIVEAIAHGRLDAAVVWGPQAGFFARREKLELARASAPADLSVPFEFSISIGVRRGNEALREALDAVIAQRRGEIDRILAEYGVPRLQ
jgi:quinoprotein dehydrogenase-associated probable ABC transporter substrate-binding protein